MYTKKPFRLRHPLQTTLLVGVLCALFGCSDEIFIPHQSQQQLLLLSGQIMQENTTRASDFGFVCGDRMGVFIVDYEDGQAGEMHATDNRASNLVYTLAEEDYRWTAPTTVYWRDAVTPVDVYAYYPLANYIEQPSQYQFEVQADQNIEARNGDLSTYEQSDLLWGKQTKVNPTTEVITVKMSHRLAGVRVQLIKGEGMSDTEWTKLDRIVTVDNTVRQATVNLSTGTAIVSGSATEVISMMPQSNDSYRAIVIPQTVSAGKSLISITLDGLVYSHKLTSTMLYQAGKLHNFTITVNKDEHTGDYSISVADDGIMPWTNDEASHQFSSMQYVIVNCQEPGKLKESIADAGLDYKSIQNLKVTGELTAEDIYFLKNDMAALTHLNLRDVRMRHMNTQSIWNLSPSDKIFNKVFIGYEDDVFYGLSYNQTIRSLVLPAKLKRVGGLSSMALRYSTLEIPEGVTTIGKSCLSGNNLDNNDYAVELILPSTLDTICNNAFDGCRYYCDLNLTDNITYVGEDAFTYAPRFYGTFHVPSKLTQLDNTFSGLGRDGSFVGELEIPQGVTSIVNAFGVALKNYVSINLPQGVKKIGKGWPSRISAIHFNDDLEEIGEYCFSSHSCPFSIKLPSSLTYIGQDAFRGSGIEGELVIPEGCLRIDRMAFYSCNLTEVTLPSNLEVIPANMLSSNRLLKTITIPKHVINIGREAFANCTGLQTVVCLNPEPPTLGNDVFKGLYFDKIVLEVPEQSIELYRHDEKWSVFKNIVSHKELAYNVPEIVCMDKGTTRKGILRAESDWEVSECPEWVTVTPSSGTYKEEVTITVASGSENRQGRVVFNLKGKNYSTYTDVRQVCSANYPEDATVTLQEASADGNAIPLFLVGEGYGADDIANGRYLTDMRTQMEHLFSTEPYKSYRDYFTVSTAYACSPESGMNGMLRFNGNNNAVWQYARQHGTDINQHAAVLVLCNTPAYKCHTDLWDNGVSFSWIGKNGDGYPYDQRGDVLHHLGGRGFGKLGPEYVNHFNFMKACTCSCCNMSNEYYDAREKGWWQNVSTTPKMSELPWYRFIFNDKYAQMVDVYEGALNHARSTYRSESQSVMGAVHVYYYNAISRYEIVKRIMQAAGKSITLEEFMATDKIELPAN